MDKAHDRRLELLAAAVLLSLWGIAGLLTDRAGYTDALYEPDYTIAHVPQGGVLDEAGFQVGDSVVAVEGIPVEELGMYSRWPRSLSRRPGEALHLVASRDGTLVEGSVVARERPRIVAISRAWAYLMGSAFLWLGIWALFTVPSVHAGRLALVGLAAGLNLPGPNLGIFNGFRDHIHLLGGLLWLALFLHFLLLFPRSRALARSRWVGVLYLPLVVLVGCLGAELLLHPRLYHTFGSFTGVLSMIYLVGILGSLVAGAWTYRRELGGTGMGIMLAGWAVALLPNAVAVAGWFIPPGYDTAGQAYFPLLAVAIPVATVFAVRQEAQHSPVGTA